jgi:hypothetical protein
MNSAQRRKYKRAGLKRDTSEWWERIAQTAVDFGFPHEVRSGYSHYHRIDHMRTGEQYDNNLYDAGTIRCGCEVRGDKDLIAVITSRSNGHHVHWRKKC